MKLFSTQSEEIQNQEKLYQEAKKRQKMKTENFIVITDSDVELLQKSLQFYSENYPVINNQNQISGVLRKLYSLRTLFKNSPNKELYIQKN